MVRQADAQRVEHERARHTKSHWEWVICEESFE